MGFTVINAKTTVPKVRVRNVNVRVGVTARATQIHIPRSISSKLNLNVEEDNAWVPVSIAVGSGEHQGLVQMTVNPTESNRQIRTTRGRMTVRLVRSLLPVTDDSNMRPVPVSWLIDGSTITVELPSERYTVAPSAKEFIRHAA